MSLALIRCFHFSGRTVARLYSEGKPIPHVQTHAEKMENAQLEALAKQFAEFDCLNGDLNVLRDMMKHLVC
jgi:hypothetical protein